MSVPAAVMQQQQHHHQHHHVDPQQQRQQQRQQQKQKPQRPLPLIRPFVVIMGIAVIVYWSHRVLQMQYHRHCKADLFRVILFNQSVMCSQISSILGVVELVSNNAVKHVASQLLGMLHGVATSGAIVRQTF